MKYTEFKNGLESGHSFSVYLFEGEDAYFRERGLSLLKSKFVSEPSLNYVSFNNDVSVGELLTSLDGFPFMSEKRLTVVKEFYPKSDFIKQGLGNFLDNPNPASMLVILNEKPCEQLKKYPSVCVVDCSKQDASLLVRWIKAECGRAETTIDGETAKLLAEYCLMDMTRIETETNKLISYVGANGVIDKRIVDEMVVKDTEYKIYELTDYIGKKKYDLALAVIKDMLSKGETMQRIIVYVYNYYRRLLLSAISDKTVAELSTAFGIKEYAARKTKEQSAMFKKRALKNAVDALTDADYKIKSGLNDANEMAWITIFKIMTEN
ncbi:MAG: DNA polymerase III subunit delta [Clostridia bacterium]|nr:DNA polymerase III subunit delta [Clostridia bacterium]